MTVLLVAINAKYIHSNLGVYSLKAYGDKVLAEMGRGDGKIQIEIGEYTINHQMDDILQDIYKRKPDVVGFSCYIWNITYVRRLVRNLVKVLPGVKIWLGGPEVSYGAEEILEAEPAITGIMVGEGEETFSRLVQYYGCQEEGSTKLSGGQGLKKSWDKGENGVQGDLESGTGLETVAGIVFRQRSGQIKAAPPGPLLLLDEIPFPYKDTEGMEHRIIYYESSRGCPFSCTYCLSSIDKTVRFRSLEMVEKELEFFLDKKVPQVKFVDRTFNCKKSHCLAIWKFLLNHDNGITNFHFEISADLIDEEQLDVLKQMRPGFIQLEIGVQTVNPRTISEIRRKTDLERLEKAVGIIRRFGTIHQHLDLIAGLPYEDFSSFCRSFDRVYRMGPHQLQLGFLKVLKGSYMAKAAGDYGLCCHEEPPYEVLSTRWLSYREIVKLKMAGSMVEVYHNSCQFVYTLKEMARRWESPCAMFLDIGEYYERRGLAGLSHSRLARYEILYDFLKEADPGRTESYQDLLMYDLYLRENVKSRPAFALDQSRYKAAVREFFVNEDKNPVYLKGYEGYDSRQMSKMAHIEVMSDGRMVLFDYRHRDPLSHNAKAVTVGYVQTCLSGNEKELTEKGENRSCINR